MKYMAKLVFVIIACFVYGVSLAFMIPVIYTLAHHHQLMNTIFGSVGGTGSGTNQ